MYFAFDPGRGLGQLVAVAGVIGETHHLVALVVVAQDHDLRAQPLARRRNPLVHRLVRLH